MAQEATVCTRPPHKRWHQTFVARMAMLAAALLLARGFMTGERVAAEPKGQRLPAPELEGGVSWLNTAKPIHLKDLRGKIVVLDFWTYCCINCIHTLPDLARIEKTFPNEVMVIGVHSAKFDNEKETAHIRKAILRYEVTHPVVNDANMTIWRNYSVQSWPTLVIIDPEGNLDRMGSGEGLYAPLEARIKELIKIHTEKGTLNTKPLKFELARENSQSPLFFPGKVLADARGKRLFIADSTHHRIVITDLDGKKIAIAGTGRPGNADGPFSSAAFNDPQGMALDGQQLYVADRKNHLIRRLNLKDRTVVTVAGTGEQGHDRMVAGTALKTGLNSPWDLLLRGGVLYIAMAGHHQIWALDIAKDMLEPFAGSGAEDIRDGPRSLARFAQPSGLATDGNWLYVADSEVSAIRAISFKEDLVKTIVGEGLFKFGDVDGQGNAVRLQHALGVAYVNGKLYVADTYNSKLKVIDPNRRTSAAFAGSADSGPAFVEPAGISAANNKLYVADTNAHRIRVVDLKTKTISTLKLQGVEPPKTPLTASREHPMDGRIEGQERSK